MLQPAVFSPPPVVATVPTAYNERVVAFLRQPNVIDVLRFVKNINVNCVTYISGC